MKNIIRGFVVTLLAVLMLAQAGAAEWLTDLPKAQAQAKKEKKMVLLDFTGSDWCGWCIKFDKEVFATKAFGDYAKTNLVLVVVDFPDKKPQPPALVAANKTLQVRYGVQGFPTLVILNSEGKEIGRQGGYKPGGPKAFTAWLEGLKKK